MKTKKIIAETMPLALKMVRQQLGDNAIIVNTRAIKTGGMFGFFSKQKYEVTAYTIDKKSPNAEPKYAVELKQKSDKNTISKQNEQWNKGETEKKSSGFHKNPQSLYNYYAQSSEPKESVQPKDLKEFKELKELTVLKEGNVPKASFQQTSEADNHLLDEIKNMRKMMTNLMMNDTQRNVLPASLTAIITRLKKQGVEEEVLDHIVHSLMTKYEAIAELNDGEIDSEVIFILEEIIKKRLPESNTINDQTRMINIIGPTGVGKTTSIAKLATEQVLKQKRRVAMITTDVYRIAAVEQLKTYAGILNVPIEVVRTADELDMAIRKLEHYDLIYMDTTGRNYKEGKYRDSVYEFLTHPLKSENYLVLSMTTKFEDMEILLKEFIGSPIRKLILTKFDETSTYGSILNIAFKYPYELSYITNGQSVPEDITTIDAAILSRTLLGRD